MSKPVIVFDLDDTLFETRNWFRKYFTVLGIKYPQTNDYFLDKDVDPKVIKFALDCGFYMTEAEPVEGAAHYVNRLLSAGYDVHYATHRGYHEKAGELTIQSLYRHDLLKSVVSLIVIDPSRCPCKMKVLDEMFDKYVLVEDMPKGVRTCKGQTIIYDRPWNRSITNAPRISGLDGLMSAIENLIWFN